MRYFCKILYAFKFPFIPISPYLGFVIMVNTKILGIAGLVLVSFVVVSALLVLFLSNSPVDQKEFDFTVNGSNECLRFLTRDVGVVYVPLAIRSNEQWKLVVECTEIGAPNGWTDLYLYEGYWDGGFNNTCYSEDIYPILDGVESLDYALGLGNPYSRIFTGVESTGYTLFFIFPPGGPSSFHITLDRLP